MNWRSWAVDFILIGVGLGLMTLYLGSGRPWLLLLGVLLVVVVSYGVLFAHVHDRQVDGADAGAGSRAVARELGVLLTLSFGCLCLLVGTNDDDLADPVSAVDFDSQTAADEQLLASAPEAERPMFREALNLRRVLSTVESGRSAEDERSEEALLQDVRDRLDQFIEDLRRRSPPGVGRGPEAPSATGEGGPPAQWETRPRRGQGPASSVASRVVRESDRSEARKQELDLLLGAVGMLISPFGGLLGSLQGEAVRRIAESLNQIVMPRNSDLDRYFEDASASDAVERGDVLLETARAAGWSEEGLRDFEREVALSQSGARSMILALEGEPELTADQLTSRFGQFNSVAEKQRVLRFAATVLDRRLIETLRAVPVAGGFVG